MECRWSDPVSRPLPPPPPHPGYLVDASDGDPTRCMVCGIPRDDHTVLIDSRTMQLCGMDGDWHFIRDLDPEPGFAPPPRRTVTGCQR